MEYSGSEIPFRFRRIGIFNRGIETVEDSNDTKQPKPGRVEAFRGLPENILKNLTKEEVRAFMFEDEWPESLAEKLKDYMV